MEYIKKEDLIKGEIYRHNNGNLVQYLYDYDNTKVYGHFIGDGRSIFKNYNETISTFKIENLQLATSEEKHWLLECIKLNKFITFEEAMKTFIPEYYEYIGSDTSWKFGKIYKLNEDNSLDFESGRKCTFNDYHTNTNLFKPSTKEAYNAQFVVKEPEFILPEKWVIKITEENKPIVQQCSHLNKYLNYDYTINGYYGNKCGGSFQIYGDNIEITFEQFKKYVLKEEIIEEKVIEQSTSETKTELELWLEDTKSLNLNLHDLINYVASGTTCNYNKIYTKLEGVGSQDKAKILFDKWNKEIIEPLPQFKVIETVETITKVQNNEGNQFFIGDRFKSELNHIHKIKSFTYNNEKTEIFAINEFEIAFNINDIEHYIEPKDNFVLPEKWCIKTNLDNIAIISKWFKENKQGNANDYDAIRKDGIAPIYEQLCFPGINICGIKYHGMYKGLIYDNYKEITFEQFKKYVLNENN